MIVSALLSVLISFAPVSRDDAIPTRIASRGSGSYPAWIAASSATTSDGSPNSGDLDSSAVESLQHYLSMPPTNGCIKVGPYAIDYVDSGRNRSSLNSAVDTASFIVEGEIDAQAPGFHAGIPGQLYRIKVITALKGAGRHEAYYFFLPLGTVPVGDKRLCVETLEYPSPPEAGDRVVLFTDEPYEHQLLEVEHQSDIILEKKDGHVSVSKRLLASEPGLSSSTGPSLIARIAQRVAINAGANQ